MMLALIIAALAFGSWIYLLAARGRFWRASERDDNGQTPPYAGAAWPSVVAIVPARNEADLVAESVGALLRQRYSGAFCIVLVDDQSEDDTAAAVRRAAVANAATERVTVLAGAAVPDGWTGKLWAMAQGVGHADTLGERPEYLLFTDADIVCGPDVLAWLVARAQGSGLMLTSVMAKLRCESAAERALVPAFVFFFQMLYPFAWVNRADRSTAAAAGGCMLVRRDALAASGGLEAIRDALIDDCALARRLKRRGPIWLGLSERVRSVRPYPRVRDLRRMVARTAFAQLRFSPWCLGGTALAMAATYLAPPVLTLCGSGAARILGAAAWAAMTFALQPVLRYYRVSPLWGLALPAIAAVYLVFTLDSAYQHWRGRGGMWKGRAQAQARLAR